MPETLDSVNKSQIIKFSQGWEICKLGDLAFVSSGTTPSRSVPGYWQDGSISWVKTGEVDYKTVEDTEEKVTPRALAETSLTVYPVGTVLVAMYGQGLTRGKVGILGIEATTNQACAAIIPRDERLVSRYLFHYFSYHYHTIRSISHGSNQSNLSESLLASFRIHLPTIVEQHRITEIVDTIDSTIAQTSALIAKLKQMKAGLLNDLLTCGLDENGELRDAIAHPEQFKPSPLGQIPKDWDARTLREILTGIDAGKSPSCPDMPAAAGEWGVLKVSAVHPSGFKPEENKVITNPVFINPAYEVKHHDLLITRSNTYDLVGLTCLVQNPPSQLLISDKTLRLNVNPQLVSIEFLAHVMQMPNIRLQIQTNATGSSAGMKNISQEEIKGFCVALPEKVDEQNRIVEVLNSYSNRIHFEEIYLGKLKAQKKGLMNNLLTGVVRVI